MDKGKNKNKSDTYADNLFDLSFSTFLKTRLKLMAEYNKNREIQLQI
jgi:hypothetical protein